MVYHDPFVSSFREVKCVDITQAQMSPVNCWPWSHNWTKWKDIEQGSVVRKCAY
jgi:hypothetical protein